MPSTAVVSIERGIREWPMTDEFLGGSVSVVLEPDISDGSDVLLKPICRTSVV